MPTRKRTISHPRSGNGVSIPDWLTVDSVKRTAQSRRQPKRAKRTAADAERCPLNQAAHHYVDLGLPITLCPANSKVPFSKNWANKVWAHDAIDSEFGGRGLLNVGLIFGPKSGLIDIEIDGQGGDDALLRLFDDDVPVTPMWRSSRGAHRLFQWHAHLEQIGKASVAFEGLEVRLGAGGKAAQSLLPPSETEGFRREWVITLADCNPAPLPLEVRQRMLDMFGRQSCAMPVEEELVHSMKHSNAVYHTVSQRVSQAQSGSTGGPVSRGLVRQDVRRGSGRSVNVEQSIARAIQNTLPGSEGSRNRQLLQFARHLKAIPELARATAESFKPAVKQWYEQARPSIGTKDFNVTWGDFLVAWRNAKFAVGQGPLADIYAEGLLHTPEIASRFKSEGVRNLVSLCRELQVRQGESPFWLACRAAAPLLRVSPITTNRWLWKLIHSEVIDLVTKGTLGYASQYRYRGD